MSEWVSEGQSESECVQNKNTAATAAVTKTTTSTAEKKQTCLTFVCIRIPLRKIHSIDSTEGRSMGTFSFSLSYRIIHNKCKRTQDEPNERTKRKTYIVHGNPWLNKNKNNANDNGSKTENENTNTCKACCCCYLAIQGFDVWQYARTHTPLPHILSHARRAMDLLSFSQSISGKCVSTFPLSIYCTIYHIHINAQRWNVLVGWTD